MLDAERRPAGFDARRDARSRTYCYRVLASPVRHPFEVGRALWWPHALDREALDRCAAALVGQHDFTAFTPTQTDHVRFERDVIARRVARAPAVGAVPGRAAGALDRGRLLHAPHGPGPGRHDARGRGRQAQPGRVRGAASRRSTRAAPARRLLRTASTWRRSATERSASVCRAGLGVVAAAQLDLAEARRAARQVDRRAGGEQHRLALGVGHRGAGDRESCGPRGRPRPGRSARSRRGAPGAGS